MMFLIRDTGKTTDFVTFAFLVFGGDRSSSSIGAVTGGEWLVLRSGRAELVIRDGGSLTIIAWEVLGKPCVEIDLEVGGAAELVMTGNERDRPTREGGSFTVMVLYPVLSLEMLTLLTLLPVMLALLPVALPLLPVGGLLPAALIDLAWVYFFGTEGGNGSGASCT